MDRVAELEAENKRLRKQNNPCRGHMEDYPEGVCWLCEIRRLRAALECCADMLRRVDSGRATESGIDFAMDAARDALKETGDDW